MPNILRKSVPLKNITNVKKDILKPCKNLSNDEEIIYKSQVAHDKVRSEEHTSELQSLV